MNTVGGKRIYVNSENKNSQSKMPKTEPSVELTTPSEQQNMICSICFDPWTNNGPHKIVSLKCGHLFGESCIKKWVANSKRCPQCNAISKLSDLRHIYVSNIVCLELPYEKIERLTKDLESERSKRISSEFQLKQKTEEFSILNDKYQHLLETVKTLKGTINDPIKNISNVSNRVQQTKK